MRTATRPGIAAVALGVLLGTGACAYEGPQSLPLPGGTGGGGYEVVVVLPDATNLVAKGTCRSGDTVVGQVASVELDANYDARVVCEIDPDVTLPANVTATLRETSLLGERYIALDPPRGTAPEGELAPGTEIPPERTAAHPDTETVLGALSLVLNGGSLGTIETISRELTAALEQPGEVRTTTRRLASLLATLDGRRDSLVSALDSLARLGTTLADQRSVIAEALDAVPAGLAALDRQRPALVRMLTRLSRLSSTAVPLIRRSKAATIADLEHLEPVLADLSKAKNELSRTVERLSSFPFSRNALSTIKGDYAGMYGQALINVDTINTFLASLAASQPSAAGPASASGDAATPEDLLAGLDLSTLVGDVADGVSSTLDLSTLLAPRASSPARPPRTLGELLTGGFS